MSEEEMDAWRGLLRAHSSLAKRLDSALEGSHGLPLRAFEVLHYLAEAGDLMAEVGVLCDRLAVIDRGRVVASGTPGELRAWTGCDDLEEVFMEALARAGAGGKEPCR